MGWIRHLYLSRSHPPMLPAFRSSKCYWAHPSNSAPVSTHPPRIALTRPLSLSKSLDRPLFRPTPSCPIWTDPTKKLIAREYPEHREGWFRTDVLDARHKCIEGKIRGRKPL